ASHQVFVPSFSVVGFLSHTKTFHDFFAMFTTPAMAPITTFMVEYGHLLIGLSLLTGLLVRVSAAFGVLLMITYWFAHMDWPFIENTNNFIVDYHLVYAGVLVYLIVKRAGIDQVIVDDEVVGVLDERPVHVGEPVGDHQKHAEGGADAHQQSGEQRQTDQQVAVLDHEGGDRRHRRGREHREEVMEGLGVAQEADNAEARHEDLMRRGVEERPRHDEAEVENNAFFHR